MMGNCKFCGEPAGLFRSEHKECRIKHDRRERKQEIESKIIISEIENAGILKRDLQSLEKKLLEIAKSNNINKASFKNLIILGWEKSVDKAFDDGILTEDEQSNLTNMMEYFSLSQSLLDKHGAFTKLVQGSILRDIVNGIIPEKVQIDMDLPFNLQKTEKIIWLFQNVDYYEQKKRTQYVGGSQGVSMRVAKGLYYRVGAFKGERVETNETLHADTGLLGITNKHIYFSGNEKNFRIKYDKIVSFQPFSDGISLQKDTATAKPQSFVTGDGWFVYNLITNIARSL